MKVVRVVVDELPEKCEKCIYGRIIADEKVYATYKFLDVRWCSAAQKMIFDDSLIEGRPDFCPLVAGSKGITQREYNLRKLNPYDLNDVAKITRK